MQPEHVVVDPDRVQFEERLDGRHHLEHPGHLGGVSGVLRAGHTKGGWMEREKPSSSE